MKKIILTAAIFLIELSGLTNAQWIEQTNGVPNKFLSDIFVFDEHSAITVGWGTILKTSNGGETWMSIPHDTTDWPSSIYFVNDSVGWIGGGGGLFNTGQIQKTTNGGITWVSQLFVESIGISSIFFINENTGWAVGTFVGGVAWGVIYKTIDGGVNWNWLTQDLDGDGSLLGAYSNLVVFFVNDYIGWVGGGYAVAGGFISKTTDGGLSWNNQQVEDLGSVNDVFFIDEDTGWLAASKWNETSWQKAIFKTTDGGVNWINQGLFDEGGLSSVFFVNENMGWTVGWNGTILKTTNGGNFWFTQESGTTYNLNSVHFANKNTGWVIGGNYNGEGTVLETTNGGVTFVADETTQPKEFILEQNYPNPFNPSTKIRYSVPQTAQVQIKVYDVLGNEIETLVDEEKSAGAYEMNWNAVNLPSGVYFYQLKAGSFTDTKKMILMK